MERKERESLIASILAHNSFQEAQIMAIERGFPIEYLHFSSKCEEIPSGLDAGRDYHLFTEPRGRVVLVPKFARGRAIYIGEMDLSKPQSQTDQDYEASHQEVFSSLVAIRNM